MEDDTTIAQEDQTQNCSNGGGSGGIGGIGRSSKKPRQKKVPQRGLGVAQLEKIRLEEQQKRDAAAMLSSPCSVPSNKSSYLPLPIQNLHYSNQSPSSLIPLPSGSPADFRSPISLQHMMDGKVPTPSTVPLANSGGFEACWSSASASVHGNVPKLCGSQESDFEKERFRVVQPHLGPAQFGAENTTISSTFIIQMFDLKAVSNITLLCISYNFIATSTNFLCYVVKMLSSHILICHVLNEFSKILW